MDSGQATGCSDRRLAVVDETDCLMIDQQELLRRVHQASESSELVRAASLIQQDDGVRFALDDARIRHLTADEVKALEKQGNRADDWKRVRVCEAFSTNSVRDCEFYGKVVLGRFTKSLDLIGDTEIPSGLYRSAIVDCTIGHDVLVRNVDLLARQVVGSEAVVFGCGSIIGEGQTAFGNGTKISVGLETGERQVAAFAEIDVEIANCVAKSRADRPLIESYEKAVADYAQRVTLESGVICKRANVQNTKTVHNCFIGPYARIDGATLVSESTLLSSENYQTEISSAAYVSQSIVQWGGSVTRMAVVERSVLTEHSSVALHGKVSHCIVGLNTRIAKGEATACLLGPFVGFQHQALLIAALWPEGKGNVGYGAKIGSNHTSKAPDQEIWPGEGTFFGLGVNIKFPTDFSRAPYSIIASGVNTLPQKVAFPFSLINSPSISPPEVSPAYNEIIPAWVLIDNMYSLKRNEEKFKSRNKATRNSIRFDVFRPEIIDLMSTASERLDSIQETKPVYTDRDIQGLGKNFLLDRHRLTAIEAYHFYVKYYALMGLKLVIEQWLANVQGQRVDELLTTTHDDPIWEYQRLLLCKYGVTDIVDGLREVAAMTEKVAQEVERSKAKDDQRGARIIDDYADAHPAASQDKFVQQTWQKTQRQLDETKGLIKKMTGRA